VHFAEQPEGQGKSIPHPGEAMLNRRDAIRNLGHVVEQGRRCLVVFERPQIESAAYRWIAQLTKAKR
jgi:hypothetical protein